MAITTTSATATTATTTTAKTATTNIATTLGAGSGVDTAALVKSLVEAQFAGKTARLTKQADTLTAQISSVAEVKSGITGFASALTTLAESGGLATQLSSSSAAVKVSVAAGARTSNVTASVNVARLATAQVAVTRDTFASGAAVGSGTLELKLGSVAGDGSFAWNNTVIPPITITADDGKSLQGVADKITAAKTGITASVITDASGQRLVLKSSEGATQAFTLTATPASGDAGLERLNVDFDDANGGASVTTRAGNAVLSVDGVPIISATNTVTGAIPGVKLELKATTDTSPAAITSSQPTDALTQAVNNVVATYNEMLASVNQATDPIGGTLRADPAAMALKRSLSRLTLADLTGTTGNAPKTLASIGVATNNDGTLRVDKDLLAKALSDYPDAVEAMFLPGTGTDGTTGTGLSVALNKIAVAARSTTTGLGASDTRYADAQKTLAKEQAKLTEQSEVTSTRMTQQFAASEARVAAYKAQQTFMENQVKMWTRSE